MNKVRIGVLGGYRGSSMINYCKRANNAEVVAICDKSHEVLDAQRGNAEGLNVTFYDNFEDFINHDMDAVVLANYATEHVPFAIRCMEAGKHVMCEKPMAHTSADAQAMLDAWKKSGKKFTIGYQNRFRPEVQMLHQCCENDELGEIYFAKAHAIRRRAVPTWGVFPNKALQGGGPLIDIGTHALDLTLWMMDNYEPVSVTGQVFYKLGNLQQATEGNMFGPWDPETYEVEDSAFGMIKFKNGAAIQLEASWALNVQTSREASTTLCGTKAGAEAYIDKYIGLSGSCDQVVGEGGLSGTVFS